MGQGTSPLDALLWAFLGLLVAIPIMLLLKAAIDGAIDTGAALACCGVIVVLFGAVWRTAGTMWMLGFVLLLLVACAAFPYYFTQLDKKELKRMDDEDRGQYIAALERDPRNASAHAMLAESYLKTDEPAAAAQHLRAAITLITIPQGGSQDRHHILDQNPNLEKWRRRLRNAEEAQAALEAKLAARAK